MLTTASTCGCCCEDSGWWAAGHDVVRYASFSAMNDAFTHCGSSLLHGTYYVVCCLGLAWAFLAAYPVFGIFWEKGPLYIGIKNNYLSLEW